MWTERFFFLKNAQSFVTVKETSFQACYLSKQLIKFCTKTLMHRRFPQTFWVQTSPYLLTIQFFNGPKLTKDIYCSVYMHDW